MKKSVLLFSVISLLFLGSLNTVKAQEQPAPKKDTVNMDTDAKPQFYYAAEDDKAVAKGESSIGTTGIVVIIVGSILIIGGVVFFLLKKKK